MSSPIIVDKTKRTESCNPHCRAEPCASFNRPSILLVPERDDTGDYIRATFGGFAGRPMRTRERALLDLARVLTEKGHMTCLLAQIGIRDLTDKEAS